MTTEDTFEDVAESKGYWRIDIADFFREDFNSDLTVDENLENLRNFVLKKERSKVERLEDIANKLRYHRVNIKEVI